jgi:menaquinone-dependent protoporphyrinogen oxidase
MAEKYKSRDEKEYCMKVLVSAASRHGATSEIAEEIGKALHERGDDEVVVDMRSAERVSSVEDYDAVVLGSAVYAGHWLEPARELAERHAGALAARPVWLFSSGPVGEPPKAAEEESVDVSRILEPPGREVTGCSPEGSTRAL